MKKLRELFQSKFEEIDDLEVSTLISDDIMEKGKTYFTYTLSKNYRGSDMSANYTYRVNLIGYLKRVQDDEENTLEILDNKAEEIKEKMKELNLKSNFTDITFIDRVRKIQITAEVQYNELINRLV